MKALVAGAGGFVGGHLVRRLLADGYEVRAVDSKQYDDWYQRDPDAENRWGDLSYSDDCRVVVRDMDEVYNLAADMGGMGFIANHKADCMLSVRSSTNLLVAARDEGVRRFFFASSACVYNADKQTDPDVTALREEDAYPAMCEDGYGWEKLFTERMCGHFLEDYGLQTRVARFHNVYGPDGTFDGGREKAPAAICRKVIEAQLSGSDTIEIWGDGEQTRSFMYVDDCIEGTRRIMDSDITYPINLGSTELVTINQLVDIVEDIAGIRLVRAYNLDAPQGVRGRNSDNTRLRRELDWEPRIPLREGLRYLYDWIWTMMSFSDEGSRGHRRPVGRLQDAR